MASLNQCEFIGNLGADPEIKSVGQGGTKVANFSIACTEKWKDRTSGDTKEKTEWVRVVVWQEGLVKVVEQYLKKGSKVYLSGQMQTRKYEKDGRDVYTTEIVLQGFGGKLIMLDGKNNSGDSGGGQQQPAQQSSARPGADRGGQGGGYGGGSSMDDDVPFAAIF